MKTKILLFFAFVSLWISAVSQTSIENRLKRISTSHYQQILDDSNFINIPMDFNDMKPNSKFSKVPLNKIQSISLIYTKFKVSETFDQLNLNNQRIQFLYGLIPGLKNKKDIQWIWIEQTGCDQANTCKDYYHGLVIKLKSDVEILSSTYESATLKFYMDMYEGKVTDTKILDSLSKLPGSKIVKNCITTEVPQPTGNRIGRPRTWNGELKNKIINNLMSDLKDETSIIFHLEVDEKGNVTSLTGAENLKKRKKIESMILSDLRFTRSRYNGKFIPTNTILNVYRVDGKIKTSIISKPILPEGVEFEIDSFNYKTKYITTCNYIDITKNFSFNSLEPPVVIKVLDRNKKWKNCLVATDVTGSMSPYLGQFVYWHKLNLNASDKNNKFVFFNDGDNMMDNLKETGNVGGIYSIATSNYSEMLGTLMMAQNRGGGGDGPENNLEAIIKGLKRYPQCEGVIMVADNWATPRDLELIDKIKVPIHIILCGSGSGINLSYLDLAYKTNGTIHTIEKDILKLSSLKENEEIMIGKKIYVLGDGKFKER